MASQLSGLCRDAAWLKSYIVSSLCLTKEAMQVSVVGLGATKQPLPSFGAERCKVREHGELKDNVDLAAELPPVSAVRGFCTVVRNNDHPCAWLVCHTVGRLADHHLRSAGRLLLVQPEAASLLSDCPICVCQPETLLHAVVVNWLLQCNASL